MKKEPDLRQQQAQMAIARQRLLTLCYGDMETVRLVSVWRRPCGGNTSTHFNHSWLAS